MKWLFVVSIFFLIAASNGKAEYRAYELTITNSQTGTSRTVTSTLDNLQYPGYHPVGKDELVQIKSTWRCWDRSDGFQPICPNPSAPAPGPIEVTPGPETNSAAP